PRPLPLTQLPPLHHQPHPIPTHNPPTDLQKEAATSPPTAHTTPRKETKKRGESTSFPPFHGHDLAATPMLTLLQHQVQQHTSHPQHHDRQHADNHHDPLRRNRAALRIQHVIGSLTERTQGQREPSTGPSEPTAPASHQTSHRHIQRGSRIRLNPDGQGDRQVNRGPPTIGNETRQQVHFAEPNHSPQSDPSAPHGGERRHADRENCDDEPPRLAVRSVVGPRVRIPGPLRLDYRTGFTQPRPDRFTGGLHWTGLVHLVSDYPTGPVRYTSRLTRTGPVRYTSRGPRTGPVRYTRPGSRPDQTTRLSTSLDPVHRTSIRSAHPGLRHHTGPVHHAIHLGLVCRTTSPPLNPGIRLAPVQRRDQPFYPDQSSLGCLDTDSIILVRTGGLLTPSRPVRPVCSTRPDHRARRGGRPVHPVSLPDRSTRLLTRLFTGPVHGTRPDRLRPGLLDRRLRPVRLKLGQQPDRLRPRLLLPLPIQPKQPRRSRSAPAELGHQLVAARFYTQPLLKRG